MKSRLNYPRTFLLGLGYFCISITSSLYNSFVPVLLDKYIASTFVIGIIMTFDNIAATFFQPYFGARSDKTHTRYGRRMPYMILGIPLSAMFFALIPFESGLASLIVLIMIFNLSVCVYKAPTVALMPDLIPSPLRSEANGVINFMGGFSAMIAFMTGAAFFVRDKHLPFISTAVLMLIAIAILFKSVKEPINNITKSKKNEGILTSLRELIMNKDKSAIFMLFSILLWFVAYQGVNALFTLYSIKYLGVNSSAAAKILGYFSFSFMLMSIPAGIVAGRIGRKRTIIAGLAGLMLVSFGIMLTRSVMAVSAFMCFGGMCWALININSYPMLVEMAGEDRIGAYTGLYYFFSAIAAILGPPLFGSLVDRLGFGVLFTASLISFLLAFVTILNVKKGESAGNAEV